MLPDRLSSRRWKPTTKLPVLQHSSAAGRELDAYRLANPLSCTNGVPSHASSRHGPQAPVLSSRRIMQAQYTTHGTDPSPTQGLSRKMPSSEKWQSSLRIEGKRILLLKLRLLGDLQELIVDLPKSVAEICPFQLT